MLYKIIQHEILLWPLLCYAIDRKQGSHTAWKCAILGFAIMKYDQQML